MKKQGIFSETFPSGFRFFAEFENIACLCLTEFSLPEDLRSHKKTHETRNPCFTQKPKTEHCVFFFLQYEGKMNHSRPSLRVKLRTSGHWLGTGTGARVTTTLRV